MPVLRAAEAPGFDLPGVHFIGLTAPSRGASEICTWRLEIAPQSDSGEPHWLDHEEVFILLEGGLHAVVGGEEVNVAAGDTLMVPAHTHLQISNPGDQPSYALVCVPVGMRAFNAGGEIGTPPWAQ